MRVRKQILPLGIALTMAAVSAVPAFAASPEFTRTAEEWQRLRDDVMEYEELEDLIAEYNATVQKNAIDLKHFKNKYGTTNSEISDAYRDMANEIYASIEYPDTSDPTYGYVVASMLSAEMSAKTMEQQADNNLEDARIMALSYEQAEKTLVTVAQSNMIGYHLNRLSLRQAEIGQTQAERALESTVRMSQIGMATQVEVWNAQEAVLSAKRSVETARSSMEQTRQTLQVMLGWKYDDTPTIMEIPELDFSRLDALDPAQDQVTALEQNYTLKMNRQRLENAISETTRETTQTTIADNEKKIGAAVMTNYQSVQAAKLSYDQAEADLELANRTMQTMELQYQSGGVSKNEYENQAYVVETKEIALEIAKLNLFQTLETYDWAVKGLANAS